MCAFLALPRQKPGFTLQSFLPQAAKKDFRYNPGCMGEQKNCVCNFSTSPWRPTGWQWSLTC
jgi:hypothetical protein